MELCKKSVSCQIEIADFIIQWFFSKNRNNKNCSLFFEDTSSNREIVLRRMLTNTNKYKDFYTVKLLEEYKSL